MKSHNIFPHFRTFLFLLALAVVPAMANAQPAEPRPEADPVTVLTTPLLKGYVAEALRLKGAGEKLEITLFGNFPEVIYRSDAAFSPKLSISELDTEGLRFAMNAELKTLDGQTLGQPFVLRGRYMPWVSVPALSRRVTSDQVIAASDIDWTDVPEHLMRDDTVLKESQLIGLSPRRALAAGRPVRLSEVESPVIVKKGDTITLFYRTPYMELKTTGVAMGPGAQGEIVAVRNSDSSVTVKGVIAGPGIVQVHGRAQPIPLAMNNNHGEGL